VDTVALARFLIGKLVVRELGRARLVGRIVETEAYLVGDAACHAFRGVTERTRSLFRAHGHAYVYLAYGTSWMLNVSGEAEGVGAGVLIRALEPLQGVAAMERRPRHRARAATSRAAPVGSRRRSRSTARSTAPTSARPARSGSATTARSPA
jgi:DNA-3-methyladenine glycosylase